MVVIELTKPEMIIAASVGILRQIENIEKGRQYNYGSTEQNAWQKHIEGSAGEMALAKHLNVWWSGMFAFRKHDVDVYQVRTASRDRDSLILHREDEDKDPFVLLIGIHGRYEIRGWIYAAHGKREEWWRDPVGGRPAFFVPQESLHAWPRRSGDGTG